MSYFVGILSGVGDIFLLSCFQVFFLLNVRFKGIFELHKGNPLIDSINVKLLFIFSLRF